MQKNSKSPLKDKPLRYAGQSLDERIDMLVNEKAMTYFFSAFFVLWFAGYEWWRYFRNPAPSPKTITVLAIAWILFCTYKSIRIFKEVRNLRQGRDGERAVGQFLEELRHNGHRVFHDILADQFNVDHVVISTKGIYTIETKTYSKPLHGDARITFDGEKLLINGKEPASNAVAQVSGAARWLQSVLLESTGKKIPVKPVVLFPGWFVETKPQARNSAVWVLNPKAFPTYITNQADILVNNDVQLACYHLSRYIRTKEATR